jgi:hypothetical protein
MALPFFVVEEIDDRLVSFGGAKEKFRRTEPSQILLFFSIC